MKYKTGYDLTADATTLKITSFKNLKQLKKQIQKNFLKANNYEENLKWHPNQVVVKNKLRSELAIYILQMQQRDELNDGYMADGTLISVHNKIKSMKEADRRIRNPYKGLVKYCKLRNRDLQIIGVHMAEYWALAGLYRRICAEIKAVSFNRSKRSAIAPNYDEGIVPAINDAVYFQIIDHLLSIGKKLEKLNRVNQVLDEEGLREFFIPGLDTFSKIHFASAEAFNYKGKTDILLTDTNGNNVFIAECKLWKGRAYLLDAIKQLLNTYVTWRDEKVAIVVFNKDNKKFTEVIKTATQTIESHPLCQKTIGMRKETSYSYIFSHPDDPNKLIRLELILFNFA